MGFANDILGGAATLIRAAIKSPNFVHGSSGWNLGKDGSFEAQNATIRGTVTASTIIGALIESAASGRRSTFDANGDIKVYNASGAVLFWFNNADNAQFYYADTGSVTQGALAESIAAVAGTDPFGNSYPAGMATYAGSTATFVNLNGGFLNVVSGSLGGQINSPSAGQMQVIATNVLVLGASSGSGYITVNSPLSAPIAISQPGALGTAETWHPMTLLNSWANGAGGPAAQYRLLASPPKTVEVIGRLTAPVGIAANQSIWTIPANYIPAHTQSLLARNVTTNATVMLRVNAAGPDIDYQAGAVAGDTIDFHGFFSLDA